MACSKISWKQCLRKNWLVLATAGCAILALIIGIVVNVSVNVTKREAMYVGYIGHLFMNIKKSMTVPVVVTSIIVAVGRLDHSVSAKIGCRAIVYYIGTTILATCLGMTLVLTLQPGRGVVLGNSEHQERGSEEEVEKLNTDNLLDLLASFFPPNIIQATMQRLGTELIVPQNETDTIKNSSKETWEFKTDQPVNNTNFLGLIFWSLLIGIAISSLGHDGKPVLQFAAAILDIIMALSNYIINLIPLAILFILLEKTVEVEDYGELFKGLGAYIGTLLLGLSIHGFIIVPAIYGIIVGKQPYRLIADMSVALMTAFGTSSSSSTIPMTIICLEENSNIDPRVARFLAPIGANINKDATALYEAITTTFLVQARKQDYTVAQVLGVSAAAILGSIGVSGVSQGVQSWYWTAMVLEMAGLPSDNVALIMAADWLSDRFRTTINVLGDAFGAGIVQHLSKDDLKMMDEAKKEDSRVSSMKWLGLRTFIIAGELNGSRQSGRSNDGVERKSNLIRNVPTSQEM